MITDVKKLSFTFFRSYDHLVELKLNKVLSVVYIIVLDITHLQH